MTHLTKKTYQKLFTLYNKVEKICDSDILFEFFDESYDIITEFETLLNEIILDENLTIIDRYVVTTMSAYVESILSEIDQIAEEIEDDEQQIKEN